MAFGFGQRHSTSSEGVRRMLGELGRRRVNFSEDELTAAGPEGWRHDIARQPLPTEEPGPPEPAGSWEIARRLVADYAFADPRIVEAVYDPGAPLEGRDMLLIGRFFGLRFDLGVRVSEVRDEERQVDGRPVRVWGWDYETLEGHLEAGRMGYEVWKWTDTGEVEFRVHRVVRRGTLRSGVVGLGWLVFGRWMQERFVRRARKRMAALVRQVMEQRRR